MKPLPFLCLLLTSSTLLIGQRSVPGITVGELAPSEQGDGPGCSYEPPELAGKPGAPVLFAVFGYPTVANIRVNGVLHQLKRKSSKALTPLRTEVIDHWADESLTVIFHYRNTDEGEGFIPAEGELKITLGSSMKTIKVKGGCGC